MILLAFVLLMATALQMPYYSIGFEFPTTGFQVLVDSSATTPTKAALFQEELTPFDAWIVNSNNQPQREEQSSSTTTRRNNFVKYSPTSDSDINNFVGDPLCCGIIAPIQARSRLLNRQQQQRQQRLTWIWKLNEESTGISGGGGDDAVSISSNLKLDLESSFSSPVSSSDSNEVICLEGGLIEAIQKLNLLPPGVSIIWKPIPSGCWTMVDVWKFRSLGCRGIWLDITDIDANLYRKLKRPCSAMDYSPTIYMIGEDEIS